MKRIFIALVCLVIFSAPILFVGCGNNNTPTNNPPPNFEDDLEVPSNPDEPTTPETPVLPSEPTAPPSEPEEPSLPENPSEPEDPIIPDDPTTPEDPPVVDPPVNEPITPPAPPVDDGNESEVDPSNPTIDPLPDPAPVVSLDFTIYNSKPNVVYDLSNNKIYVKLTENLDDNIVHFKCLIYVANELASYQDIVCNLTNEDKLANKNPQNSSNFYFKFCEVGTYTLTFEVVSVNYVKTIDIIVE